MDIHIADVVARAGARLAALVRWPRAPGLQRPDGLTPGVAARVDPAEAAAWEAIVREAFRAGTTVEAPRPLPPAPTAESPASTSGVARPVASVFAPRAPATARPVASVSAPTAPAAAPSAAPEREPAAAEGPSPRHRRQAGETAPDYLLRKPTSGTPVADDFFDGLIRRVEDHR